MMWEDGWGLRGDLDEAQKSCPYWDSNAGLSSPYHYAIPAAIRTIILLINRRWGREAEIVVQ